MSNNTDRLIVFFIKQVLLYLNISQVVKMNTDFINLLYVKNSYVYWYDF